jgi:hypothetical protein
MDDNKSEPINLWTPTGTGLLVMGVLTLATPLFTTLTDSQWLIDAVAGGGLGLAGVVCLVRGFRVSR